MVADGMMVEHMNMDVEDQEPRVEEFDNTYQLLPEQNVHIRPQFP